MQTSDSVLNEIVKRLSAEFHPSKIYLFGSRAKGTARATSDYDLVIVIPSSNVPRIDLMQKAEEVLWGIWAATDILVYTEKEFTELKEVSGSIAETVALEGTELDVA